MVEKCPLTFLLSLFLSSKSFIQVLTTTDVLFYSILVGVLLWNYWLSVLTDPGRVPDTWVCSPCSEYRNPWSMNYCQQPDTNVDGYEVKKLTGRPRHCRMCKKYKPPRTHHCRQCNRSVRQLIHGAVCSSA